MEMSGLQARMAAESGEGGEMSTGKGAMGHEASKECHGCDRPIRGAAQTYGALVLCAVCMQAFAADKAVISKQIGRWLAPVEWEPIGSAPGSTRLRRDPEWWMLTLTPEEAGRLDSPRQWQEEAPAVPIPPPVVPVVTPEPVVVIVPPAARSYAPVEAVSRRVLRVRAEGEARYQRLIAWLPTDRMMTIPEAAGELGCSVAQAGLAIRRGVAAGQIRSWPAQGFSAPDYQRPPTVADRVVAWLEEHGESRVSAIAEGTGLKWKAVKTAARADRRVEPFGLGVLRVRK